MKKRFLTVAICCVLSLLAGCSSGVSQEEYDKMVSALQEAQNTIETLSEENVLLQEQVDSITSDLSKLQAEKDILEARYKAATVSSQQAEEETPQGKEKNYFQDDLPDGLAVKAQFLDDDCVLILHYRNDTGKPISLTTYYTFGDADMNAYMSGANAMMYFADGTDRFEVIESWDTVESLGLDYDIGTPLKKMREINESLTFETRQNGDGSVSALFSSPNGTSVDGYIFYLDENDEVLGYEHFGIGFAGEMDYSFSAPGYEYDHYILSCEALG